MRSEIKPIPERKRLSRENASDILIVAGGIAVSIGVGMIYLAAGVIVGGALAIAEGWILMRGE